MSFSCPEFGLEDILNIAARYGYDGVELRLDAQHQHGVEVGLGAPARGQVREIIGSGRIPVCCLATSCRFADPEDVKRHLQDALQRIDLAADVGVPRIRVFGGKFPASVSREEAIALVAGSLRSIADRAFERGVTICMETHDAWCDPEHVAEVMRRVDHASVGVNWDIMHPVRTAHVTIEQSFDALGDWIRHVHFHDGDDRDGGLKMLPIGQGVIDHRTAVRLLKGAGYDGYLSGEWINWEPWEVHLPRELAAMRSLEREV